MDRNNNHFKDITYTHDGKYQSCGYTTDQLASPNHVQNNPISVSRIHH